MRLPATHVSGGVREVVSAVREADARLESSGGGPPTHHGRRAPEDRRPCADAGLPYSVVDGSSRRRSAQPRSVLVPGEHGTRNTACGNTGYHKRQGTRKSEHGLRQHCTSNIRNRAERR